MVPDLRVDDRLFDRGDRKVIRGGDLMAESLRAGNPITVFRKQLPDDKVGWFGHGGYEHDRSPSSFMKGDIVRQSDGASIDGDLIAVVADSDGNALADRRISDLEDLREAAAQARTDRPEMPAMSVDGENVVGPSRYLELRLDAHDDSDGDTIDPAASSLKQYYSTDGN